MKVLSEFPGALRKPWDAGRERGLIISWSLPGISEHWGLGFSLETLNLLLACPWGGAAGRCSADRRFDPDSPHSKLAVDLLFPETVGSHDLSGWQVVVEHPE
jgi:hypothetical protein